MLGRDLEWQIVTRPEPINFPPWKMIIDSVKKHNGTFGDKQLDSVQGRCSWKEQPAYDYWNPTINYGYKSDAHSRAASSSSRRDGWDRSIIAHAVLAEFDN